MTGLTVIKNQGETWRDAVIRIAKKFGLEDECIPIFDSQVDGGVPENEAAYNALYEFDAVEEVEEIEE